MPKLDVYVNNLCPYAQRVRIALAEKGLLATEIELNLRNLPDSFLALSPDGKVPLLVHDGLVISGSGVITEYLDDAFPPASLSPRTAEARARARMWVAIADARLYEPTHQLLLARAPDAQASLAGRIANNLQFVEAELSRAGGGRPYILGSEFSFADVALIPWFEQLAVLERLRGFRPHVERPCLEAWFAAVTARPGVRSVMRAPDFYLERYVALEAALA